MLGNPQQSQFNELKFNANSVWEQGRWGRDVPDTIAPFTPAIAITATNQTNKQNPIEPRPKIPIDNPKVRTKKHIASKSGSTSL
jgi:hypothetical protein